MKKSILLAAVLAFVGGIIIGVVLNFGIYVAQDVAADYYISEVIENYDSATYDGTELRFEYVNAEGKHCEEISHPHGRGLKYLLYDISELDFKY